MTTVNSKLTTYGSIYEIEQFQYAPLSPSSLQAVQAAFYGFIGKVDSWPDDNNPPSPQQNQSYIKQVFKNMVAAKRITSYNISGVIPRIDWTHNTIYDEYSDQDDMFTTDNNGIINKFFYVRNSYDQIFKCISNNNGGSSVVEPTITPGNTSVTKPFTTSDGYKWVYITTIDRGQKDKFFDNNWMPIFIGLNTPNALVEAGFGTIDAINVGNMGSGYTNGNTSTIVTITGDGDGKASAYAYVNNGQVQDVIVTNSGNNYTFATATITPAITYGGSGASANVIISPIGGNGNDPISELGCNHVMVTFEFDRSQNGTIPTDISFRQVGLLVNPLLVTGENPTGDVYNTAYSAYTSTGSGTPFIGGETIYQGQTLETATFKATLVSYDPVNTQMYLINKVGEPTIGGPLIGNTSGSSRVLLQFNSPEFSPGSGYMVYLENRIPVQRSENGIEQFRIVLRF